MVVVNLVTSVGAAVGEMEEERALELMCKWSEMNVYDREDKPIALQSKDGAMTFVRLSSVQMIVYAPSEHVSD